jgi:hypothetical protein
MAKALFINSQDIKRFSALNGSVDEDKLVQWISVAQDIHVQSYLGTDLFNKISTDIINNSISGNYLSLLNDYIKPMTIHFAMTEYLPFSAYTVANKGVYKHSSENAESVTKEEVDFLIEKHRKIASSYVERFLKYICNNSTLFPEYLSNTEEDIYPNKNNTFNGWYF